MHEEIGKIASTRLGLEDHGIPTFSLEFGLGGGSVQGFGGYDLRFWGTDILFAILRACNVSQWEALKGRTVYVLRDEPRGLIRGLKPLPTERGTGFYLEVDTGVIKEL